ncbi:MAG: hypothetical protein C0518_02585 [Opitutus sp.]|nr:hypothetical protein [Opitutus sp.]
MNRPRNRRTCRPSWTCSGTASSRRALPRNSTALAPAPLVRRPVQARFPFRRVAPATAFFAGLILLGGCTTLRPARESASPPAAQPVTWRQVSLGLCEDYPEESRSLTKARADLAAARAAGATVLRIAFGWDAMEPERGKFDWNFWDEFVAMATDEFGLRLIPYVCYTPRWAASDAGEDFWRSPPHDPEDFARFVTALVGRYRDAIASWELWNEPDNKAYWLGTPAQFAELVRAGSRAVRATDPRDVVVLGGIAGETDFLAQLFEQERIAPAVDVVNLHCYFETWHPDPIEALPDYVARAKEILRESGENEPLWMAEFGYSSVNGRARVSEVYRAWFEGEHTDEAQANALARKTMLSLATGEFELLAWYRINDLSATQEVIGDDNNLHLGIRDVRGAPKPAFVTLRQLTSWFAQPHARATTHVSHPPVNATVNVHAFQLRDGRCVVAAWLGRAGAQPPAQPVADEREVSVRIELPGFSARKASFTDALGQPLAPERVRWSEVDGAMVLHATLISSAVIFCELKADGEKTARTLALP